MSFFDKQNQTLLSLFNNNCEINFGNEQRTEFLLNGWLKSYQFANKIYTSLNIHKNS